MSGFVCAYFGRDDECPECGGFNGTGQRFCSHDCAASFAERGAEMEAARQARRDADDAFGAEVGRLRAAGHTYEEIDVLTAGMP